MKLSAYYKSLGAFVGWFSPLEQYDTVFASKVFTFTPDDDYLPHNTIKGGTGYDGEFICSELSGDMERCLPDYSLYPSFEHALGFTTRGCVRQCKFCVVPRKEGMLRIVDPELSFLDNRKSIILLDNNLTAAPFEHFKSIIEQIAGRGIRLDISQGIDIRLVSSEHARLLSKVKLLRTKGGNYRRLHFAWDNVSDEGGIRQGINTLKQHISVNKLMCYVLIGYNTTPEEDLHRVEVLRGLSVDPFVMKYDKENPYQKRFARWVNHKAIFKSVAWKDYM
jgi:hypothetical protein